MRICHIGLNHKTAPIELRERLAVAEDDIAAVLQQCIRHPAIREAALLSTCNRVEMTIVTHDPDAGIAAVHEWFAEKAEMPLDQVCDHLYSYTTDQAISHLFAVASGLDSLVLGEPQILGQVKLSYEHALTAGTAGHILHRLYQSTFAAAKRARSETEIGKTLSGKRDKFFLTTKVSPYRRERSKMLGDMLKAMTGEEQKEFHAKVRAAALEQGAKEEELKKKGRNHSKRIVGQVRAKMLDDTFGPKLDGKELVAAIERSLEESLARLKTDHVDVLFLPHGLDSPDHARYPWGRKFDPDKANTLEGRVLTTSPVGAYPAGAAVCGTLDLSGNVWEWCHSLFRAYPYDAGDGREDLLAEGRRALRGGGWDNHPSTQRLK